MAITPNGMIAKLDDDTNWVTETEWSSFSSMIKKAGNMIIGRRTYEIMLKNDDFKKSDFREIKIVVLSEKLIKTHNRKVSVVDSPQKAVQVLKEERFRTGVVCGGGGLNASFMSADLVDELYLDVEPIMFGKGIKLFAESDFETNLDLIGTKRISKNEVQLHYKIKKYVK